MQKTRHSSEIDDRHYLLAAALLRSRGMVQNEIAKELGISQARVSLLLKEAVETKLLAGAPALRRGLATEAEWAAVTRQFFPHHGIGEDLKSLAGNSIHFSAAIFSGSYDDFTYSASEHVSSLLMRSNCVGVMWGRTISQVAQAIQSTGIPPEARKRKSPEFIPLCGDPVHLMNQWEIDYSASYVARNFEKLFSGRTQPSRPCLSGVPAYVSAKIRNSQAFRQFLNSLPGYQQIFSHGQNSAPPLINGVDTVITGIGIIDETPGGGDHLTAAFIRERREQESISLSELHRLILGDIGGILIERRNLKPNERESVRALNQGWIGMKLDDLKQIAAKATADGFPGVIVVAFGASKAAMVAEICRLGLVNQLIINDSLAAELQKKLPRLFDSQR